MPESHPDSRPITQDAPSISEVLGRWTLVASAYSKCNFTFNKDKLIAMVGLADYTRHLLGEERDFWGLWRPHMELQLCWHAETPSARSRNGLAPTWSWASLDVPIAAPMMHDLLHDYQPILHAKITEVEMKGAEGRAGYLQARGVLKPRRTGSVING
jgi:hypothetical protein